jgi:hypothetical protein
MENAYCALITGSAWRQVNRREEAALIEHTPSSPRPTVWPPQANNARRGGVSGSQWGEGKQRRPDLDGDSEEKV